MKTLKKLKSKTGETLAEILVAILIIALSAGLFATLYVAAMNINLSAREEDEKLFDSVSELEENIHGNGSEDGKSSGKVQYKPEGGTGSTDDIPVDFYTKDGMTVYKESTTGAGGGSGGSETPGEGG